VRFGRLCSYRLPGRSRDPGTMARVSQEVRGLAGLAAIQQPRKGSKASSAKIRMASLSEADLQTRPQEMVSRADHLQGEADEAEVAVANWVEMHWLHMRI
jgi:hypothetical protein